MTTVPEPTDWAEKIATELRSLADDFANTATGDLPAPRMVDLHIQPGGPSKADDLVIAAVDAVGLAVLGKPGSAELVSNDTYHYAAEGIRGPIRFRLYREISTARVEQMAAAKVLADKEEELARLRAEVEQLRADRLTKPETGERVEVGAAGCGCPITEEIRPNSSSIDGTERVEHRPKCWNGAEGQPLTHVVLSANAEHTACGLAVVGLPSGDNYVTSWSAISTCKACGDEAPF